MITVEVLITRRARHNRLHLLRYIWLFPTLGTNLLEWGSVGTRISTTRRIRSDESVRNPSELIASFGVEAETVGRIAKRRHSPFHTTTRDCPRCDCGPAELHRECSVSLLFKTSITAGHLTRFTTSNAPARQTQMRANEHEQVWPAFNSTSQGHKKHMRLKRYSGRSYTGGGSCATISRICALISIVNDHGKRADW